MTDRSDYIARLWQGGVPVTAFALILLLTIVSVIITGVGLHSAFVWLILMAVCILCFTFCNCVKCKKKASLWRRSSESADTISTISDSSSIISSIYTPGYGNSNYMRWDSPPSYVAATSTELPPPPYFTLVHTFREPSINQPQTTGIPPPPYTSVIIATATNETFNHQDREQRPSTNSNSISIISGSDIMRDNKILNVNVISTNDRRTALSDDQIEVTNQQEIVRNSSVLI